MSSLRRLRASSKWGGTGATCPQRCGPRAAPRSSCGRSPLPPTPRGLPPEIRRWPAARSRPAWLTQEAKDQSRNLLDDEHRDRQVRLSSLRLAAATVVALLRSARLGTPFVFPGSRSAIRLAT